MIIKKTCKYIADSVINNIENKEDNLDSKTLELKLSVIAIYIMLIITLITIGLIFGVWRQLLVATMATVFIRSVNGGNHFDSPDLCYMVTTSSIVINPVLQYWIGDNWNRVILVFCLMIYILFSPHSENHDDKERNHKQVILVIGIVVSYIFSEVILYTYLILITDLLVKNPKWKTIKVKGAIKA